MNASKPNYVPAAGSDWLLSLYDPFTRLLGVESAHRLLVEQADIHPGQRVLEIGCGTGNLTLLSKRLCPAADVVGIDPDPKALERGRRKALDAKLLIQFDLGYAQQLPYPDSSIDRVLSAFMFHHMTPEVQQETLLQVRRVLRPTGSLHLVDFVDVGGGFHGFLGRFFHHSHGPRADASSPVITRLRAAGLLNPEIVAHQSALVGRLAFFRAEMHHAGATGSP